MYGNAKNLELFMDRVHKEAYEAAQKIYDHYTPDLINRVKAQMKEGDQFQIGMGVAAFKRGENILYTKSAEKIAELLARTQYPPPNATANFSLPDFTK